MNNDELSAFFSQMVPGSDGINNQRTNDPQTMTPLGSLADDVHQLHAPVPDYDAMLDGLFAQNDMFDDVGRTAVHRQELLVDTATTSGSSLTPTAAGTVPFTPNSSVSSSSTEAGGEDDARGTKKNQLKQEKGGEEEEKQQHKDGGERSNDKSKNLNKLQRKKGEKRQREPRVAFMTKSEVDHLEDGYRWRKYGQKAVKNSPHPRGYYRCTYQKCSVKKRVERSFKDPTIVITTYEGQHNHQIPATMRGNAHMLAPLPAASSAAAAVFRQQDLLMHQMGNSFSNYNSGNNYVDNLQGNINPDVYLPIPPPAVQQFQALDYGLLEDILPSFSKGSQL